MIHKMTRWGCFLPQPYWVEVIVEVELRLILRLKLSWSWLEPGFDLRLRLTFGWVWVEAEVVIDLWLRLSWGRVEVELNLNLSWSRVINLSWSRIELRLVYSYRLITFIIIFYPLFLGHFWLFLGLGQGLRIFFWVYLFVLTDNFHFVRFFCFFIFLVVGVILNLFRQFQAIMGVGLRSLTVLGSTHIV